MEGAAAMKLKMDFGPFMKASFTVPALFSQ
jgi:hypothetical protein